jgi:hypothetical protein
LLELSIDEVPTPAAGVEVVVDIVHERVAGLDVHKAMIVACVRLVAGGRVKRECRTFETTTSGLVALLSWLSEHSCGNGDGSDRCLLEAGLEHSERWLL